MSDYNTNGYANQELTSDTDDIHAKLEIKNYENRKFRSERRYLTYLKNGFFKGAKIENVPKLERIRDCGLYVSFATNIDFTAKKVLSMMSCNDRFCPACAWRKARKDAIKLSTMIKYAEVEHKKRFIFLTFTTRNVTSDKLKAEVDKFNAGFKKLLKRKEITQINKGCIRKLEITYNADEYITEENYAKREKHYKRRGLKIGDPNPNFNTYHPHFHVIMAVNSSYFTDSKSYLKFADYLKLWRAVTNDDEIEVVHVCRMTNDASDIDSDDLLSKMDEIDDSKSNCKEKLKDIGIATGVLEIAKYAAKDSDYLINQEVFDVFYEVLSGRQLITFNGLFTKAMKLYKTGELDEYKNKSDVEYVYKVLYKWILGKYVQREFSELTIEQMNLLNYDED